MFFSVLFGIETEIMSMNIRMLIFIWEVLSNIKIFDSK